ncbi:MAG: hypothetical protein M1832_004733 [Thelocarpon impressellum]|nr:MAG: hypothetical protein M1832_004733 [Thelocarpon impressellum]
MSDVAVTPPPRSARGKHQPPKGSAPSHRQAPAATDPQSSHHLQHTKGEISGHLNEAVLYDVFQAPLVQPDFAAMSEKPTRSSASPNRQLYSQAGALSDGAASNAETGGPRKKKATQKGRPKEARTLSSPIPAVENPTHPLATTGSSAQTNNVTPQKRVSSPPKAAYAGPTFHASPAPSALPIPSFFSKSVPDAPAPGSLGTTSQVSSQSSEASPTQAAALALAKRSDNESPLDIFFRADREEKARAAGARSSPFGARSAAAPGSPSQSPSPANSVPKHSRHGTSGSTSEMFEMDGVSSHDGPRGSSERMNAIRANTAPSSTGRTDDQEELQRQAKTQALKNLLFSPQAQRPLTTGGRYDHAPSTPNGLWASPSTAASPVGSQAHHLLESPSPTPRQSNLPNAPLTNFSPRHEPRHAAGHEAARPTARLSQLRQEVGWSEPPKQARYRALGEPGVRPKLDAAQVSLKNLSAHLPKESPEEVRPASEGSGSGKGAVKLRGMEDDLRRMLKLGGSGVPGAAGRGGGANGVSGP